MKKKRVSSKSSKKTNKNSCQITRAKNNARLIPGNPNNKADAAEITLNDIAVYPKKEQITLINIKKIRTVMFFAQ